MMDRQKEENEHSMHRSMWAHSKIKHFQLIVS